MHVTRKCKCVSAWFLYFAELGSLLKMGVLPEWNCQFCNCCLLADPTECMCHCISTSTVWKNFRWHVTPSQSSPCPWIVVPLPVVQSRLIVEKRHHGKVHCNIKLSALNQSEGGWHVNYYGKGDWVEVGDCWNLLPFVIFSKFANFQCSDRRHSIVWPSLFNSGDGQWAGTHPGWSRN